MSNPATEDRGKILVTARIIWAAMLVGELIFLAVIVLVVWPAQQRQGGAPGAAQPAFLQLLFYIGVGVFVVGVAAGYGIRALIFQTARLHGPLPASKFLGGNIILLALCEGAAFFGLVGMFLNGKPWPHLGIAIAAMAVQAVNFPTGAALEEPPGFTPVRREP